RERRGRPLSKPCFQTFFFVDFTARKVGTPFKSRDRDGGQHPERSAGALGSPFRRDREAGIGGGCLALQGNEADRDPSLGSGYGRWPTQMADVRRPIEAAYFSCRNKKG